MNIKTLIGFDDSKLEYNVTKNKLTFDKENNIIYAPNGNKFSTGNLEIISLEELRTKISNHSHNNGNIVFTHSKPTNVQELIIDSQNKNSTFQVASQFNLLEMPHYSYTPERGVGGYWYDHTQGPGCCIRTLGATLFRNYFVQMDNGQEGQTHNNQINCISNLLDAINSDGDITWDFINGYISMDSKNMIKINKKLSLLTDSDREDLKGLLKVGIHTNVQTNDKKSPLEHNINLVLCSAMPISYMGLSQDESSLFCQLILEATYEATIISSIINRKNINEKLYLTKVGGGAFGNSHNWISHAIILSIQKYQNYDLDVQLVHFGNITDPYNMIKI